MTAAVESAFRRLLELAVRECRSEHPCPHCGLLLDRRLRCDMGCGKRWRRVEGRWEEVGR